MGHSFPCLVLKGLSGSLENSCGKGVIGAMEWNPGHVGLGKGKFGNKDTNSG